MGGWVETFGLSALCTTNNNTHKLYPMVLKVGAGARKKRKGFLFLYTHTHTHTRFYYAFSSVSKES